MAKHDAFYSTRISETHTKVPKSSLQQCQELLALPLLPYPPQVQGSTHHEQPRHRDKVAESLLNL
uniref:Uncharacterized protein n=1 Tax=Anguilla anguilla TaxID=7936 RepID=A0A0E9Q955_ANGAN